jgi:virulence-associated protein VapD
MLEKKEERLWKKAINFDLDTKALEVAGFSSKFPASLIPYRLISKELRKMGFSHRQYSGYRSKKPMTDAHHKNGEPKFRSGLFIHEIG